MTKVIFRRFYPEKGGDIIAIFPELAGTNNPYKDCLSYQHIGQHGAITLDFHKFTFPITHNYPKEYFDLYNELVAMGYDDLEVVTRMSRKMLQKRIAEANYE
jgi:hypothetical protein